MPVEPESPEGQDSYDLHEKSFLIVLTMHDPMIYIKSCLSVDNYVYDFL